MTEPSPSSPSLVRVMNLQTGEICEYACPPAEAVVCAHEQYTRGNWNTADYDFSRVETNLWTYTCGDWTALRREAWAGLNPLGKTRNEVKA